VFQEYLNGIENDIRQLDLLDWLFGGLF